MEGEALFLASLPVIDDVTGRVCRKHHLSRGEADDFRSEVRLHFIDRDYEALRRFEGRSRLSTYVTVVVHRLFLDARNRQWGKWRPSAEARRRGATAILVERLITRDGLSLDQVVETLRVNHGVALDAALGAWSETLVARKARRQFVAEDCAGGVESADPAPDANVVRAEQGFMVKRVRAALERAGQALDAEERLILRMRFRDGIAVADIARTLHLDQKRLYRTIERLLAVLGERLAADGISRVDVQALLADDLLAGGADREAVDSAAAPAGRERGSWYQG